MDQQRGFWKEEKITREERNDPVAYAPLVSPQLAAPGAHQHVDDFEENAYETNKPGLGTRIKNAFRKIGGKHGTEETDVVDVTSGPQGETVKETHTTNKY